MGGGRARAARRSPSSGITVLELMPVAEFPGRFGWGYDGVDLFAPYAPLRRARRLPPLRRRAPTRSGLGVILDVVYNHLGPDGNYLRAVLRRLLHRPLQERVGRGDQLRRRRTAARCASSSSPTPATGSTSSTSTACGSTRRRRSSTPRRSTSWPRSAARAREAARRRGRSIVVAENEPQDTRLVRPAGRGRLRPRRAVERRLPPQRDGRADRPQRGLLHRLPRHAAGVHLGGQVRLPVPGPVLRVAAASAAARRRSDLPPRRSSPSSQNHDQVANSARGARAARADEPGPLPGDDRAAAARPGHADAVPGPGVRRVGAVPLLRRPRAASWPRRSRKGRARVPVAVPAAWPRRTCRRVLADPGRPGDLRALQARPRPSASGTPRRYALHRDLLRAPARGPGLPRASGAAASTARCSAPEAFVAPLLRRRTATTACCS